MRVILAWLLILTFLPVGESSVLVPPLRAASGEKSVAGLGPGLGVLKDAGVYYNGRSLNMSCYLIQEIVIVIVIRIRCFEKKSWRSLEGVASGDLSEPGWGETPTFHFLGSF